MELELFVPMKLEYHGLVYLSASALPFIPARLGIQQKATLYRWSDCWDSYI